jgi:glutamate-1-semialdehyde 2,1-aminomutase
MTAAGTAGHQGYAETDRLTKAAGVTDARVATRPDILTDPETGATVYPRFFGRAEGGYLWDADGNRYVDLLLGYGPVILGHNHERVNAAAVAELRNGHSIAPLWSPRQTELNALLCEVIPGAQSCYLLKTGSDANSAAVRLARIFTGREGVVRFGYNGWHDWAAGRPAGIPAATRDHTRLFEPARADELDTMLRARPDGTACVLMMPFEYEETEAARLQDIRDIAHRHGALLVFDEMRSGFRMSLGGAQEFFGVRADLVTLSKAMANGHPISAVAGRADVMAGLAQTRISSTFYASPVEMAAALETIAILRDTDALSRVWRLGRLFRDGLRQLARDEGIPARVTGYPVMPFMRFDTGAEEYARRFYIDVVRRGALLHPDHQWFVCAAHTDEDIAGVLAACRLAARAAAGR